MRLNRNYKMRAEKRAYRNKAFLFGDQWYVWDKSNYRMSPDESRAKWQAQLVYNLILTIVEQRTAQLIRNEHVWDAIPATTDERDRMRARTKGQVLDHQYNEVMKMKKHLREGLQWAMSSSVVFGHPFWNRDKGPELNVSLDDFMQNSPMQVPPPPPDMPPHIVQQTLAQLNQQHVQEQTNKFAHIFGQSALQAGAFQGNEGDMDFDIAPIFEVGWWPFNSKRWQDVLTWHRMVKMPCQRVADMFGMNVDDVRQYMMPAAGGRVFGSSRWADDYYNERMEDGDYDDCVYVDKLYQPPSKTYPHGREACVIGWAPQAQYVSDLQNFSNVVPLFPLTEKPIRGMIDGTCLVDQLISPQENINTSASQIADYRNRKIMPTLCRFPGDKGSKQQLSNKPGAIYDCTDPNKMPKVIEMPDIGSDYFNTIQMDTRFMHDLGGVGSIDLGNTEDSNVRSGRAIMSLQQQNSSRMIPFAEAIDEWLTDIGCFVDLEVQNRISLERTVQIVGDSNELEVIKYKGADLKATNAGQPGENKRLVRCTATSNFPKTQQEIMAFLNMAMTTMPSPMLDPVKDRDTILEMIGFNDYRAMFDKTRTDKTAATDVIDKWESGQPAGPANDADDHQTFYQVINDWKKTERYKRCIAQMNQQMVQMGITPMQFPNPLAKEIDERILAHKRGVIEDQVEKMYLARSADIRMWIQERQRWMQDGGPMGATIVQEFFPFPINTQPMMPPPGAAAEKNPDKPQPPGAPQMQPTPTPPPTEGDAKGKKKKGEPKDTNAAQADKSQSQKQVQQEMH